MSWRPKHELSGNGENNTSQQLKYIWPSFSPQHRGKYLQLCLSPVLLLLRFPPPRQVAGDSGRSTQIRRRHRRLPPFCNHPPPWQVTVAATVAVAPSSSFPCFLIWLQTASHWPVSTINHDASRPPTPLRHRRPHHRPVAGRQRPTVTTTSASFLLNGINCGKGENLTPKLILLLLWIEINLIKIIVNESEIVVVKWLKLKKYAGDADGNYKNWVCKVELEIVKFYCKSKYIILNVQYYHLWV